MANKLHWIQIAFLALYFTSPVVTTNRKIKERFRKGRDGEVDVEVILNPGPMIYPDIVMGNFVDSKVNIEDAILEELGLATNNYGNLSAFYTTTEGRARESAESDELFPDSSTSTSATLPSTSPSIPATTQMVDDEMDDLHVPELSEINMNDIQFRSGSDYYPDDENELHSKENEDAGFDYEDEIQSKDKVLGKKEPKEPCRVKMNNTFGHFQMNFSRDCVYLLSTPEVNSRLVLHCESMQMSKCSEDRDSLMVNLNGDLRFGRNSYFYCGPNSQIRVNSIKQKIAIRVRRNEELAGQEYQCHYQSRQQRFIFPSAGGAQRTNSGHKADCGRVGRGGKIVGGRRVPQGLFPWMAQLDITRIDGTHTACSGSIISEYYVLSAAHCLKNSESISVFMGGSDRREFTGSEVTIQAEKYILHRLWNSRTLAADLALVKLTEPITFTPEISPICLPPRSYKDERWEGKIGVSAGWGRLETKEPAPRQLYRVRLPFMPQTRCARIYRRYFQPSAMYCTDSNFKAAICYGDSGGPLMYKRGDKVYQLGIASFSLSKICGESPDVFTAVSEYDTWIQTRIQSNYY